MSESTASRLDRVGREQRREERQRTSTSVTASSNLVSSTSLTSSSSPSQSPIAARVTSHSEQQGFSNSDNVNGEDEVSTSTLEPGRG